MTTDDRRPAAPRQGLTATAILTASAVLLAALTILQAGRLPFNAAYAGAANQGGQGTSIVTIDSGLGPKERPYELLWVLDGRGEMVFVYYMENANAGLAAQVGPADHLAQEKRRIARGGVLHGVYEHHRAAAIEHPE
ncbi:MAG: hypothetical protein ACKOFI_04785, partial [Phycisphaerales bacterium]